MKRIATIFLGVVGCFPQPEGVQIGEENIGAPGPCEFSETPIDPDEPAFETGESASDLLAGLPLVATVSPLWFDGSDATLTVDLAWNGGEVVFRTAEAVSDETCPGPGVLLGLSGTVSSSDGRLEEVIIFPDELRLSPDAGGGQTARIAADAIGGTLDADAIAGPLLGGTSPRTVVLDLVLNLLPGEGSSGVATIIGWPGDTAEPTDVVEVVEEEIALW